MKMSTKSNVYSLNDQFKNKGTIIIIPSAFLNSEPLKALAAELSKVFEQQIIFADVPGHVENSGQSEDTVAAYANKIKSFVTQLHDENLISKDNLHVIGWSMGGSIGLQMALDGYPGITKLTLLTTSSNWSFPDIPRDAFYETFGKVAEAEMTEKHRDEIKSALGSMIAPLDTCMSDIKALQSFNVTDRLSNLDIPVEIIAGYMDKISPKEDQNVMFDHMPSASMTIIHETGHLFPVERPKDVAMLIKAWASELT